MEQLSKSRTMAKKKSATKTIIVVSASILVVGGLSFLIWKLVNNNKKKKEEDKRKKDEEEALKQMVAFANSVSDKNRNSDLIIKKGAVKGAIKGVQQAVNDYNSQEQEIPSSTQASKALLNIANKTAPTFNTKQKQFNVYKPLI